MQQTGRTEIDIQADTFANWCTYVLNDRQPPPYEASFRQIENDMQDGILLCHLISRLIHQAIEPPYLNPSTQQECLVNIRHALKTCENHRIFSSEGYSSAEAAGIREIDIFHGRLDAVLSLVYRLITHFDVIHDVDILIQVDDLSQSWRDGKALYALVARITGMDPTIPTAKHSMEIALQQLGVPDLLDPQDMCSASCDNLSIMTYLAQLRKAVETREYLSDPYIYLHFLITPTKKYHEAEAEEKDANTDSIFDKALDSVDDNAAVSLAATQQSAFMSTQYGILLLNLISRYCIFQPAKSSIDIVQNSDHEGSQPARLPTLPEDAEALTEEAATVHISFPGPPLPPRRPSGITDLKPSKPPPIYPGEPSEREKSFQSTRDGSTDLPQPQEFSDRALGKGDTHFMDENDLPVNPQVPESRVRFSGIQDTEPDLLQNQLQDLDIHDGNKRRLELQNRRVSMEHRLPELANHERQSFAHNLNRDTAQATNFSRERVGRLISNTTISQPTRHLDYPSDAAIYHPAMNSHQPVPMDRGMKSRSHFLLTPKVQDRRTSLPVQRKPHILGDTYEPPPVAFQRQYKVSLHGWIGRTWALPNHGLPGATTIPCNMRRDGPIDELNLVIDTVLRECKYHLFLTLPQCDSGFSNLYFSDSVFSFFNLLPALGPLRPYWLVITAPSVWLFDRETHQPLVEWPFNHILRYGVDTNTLSIEIGQRMNPTCAGMYIFEMSNNHHLTAFQALQQCTSYWSRRPSGQTQFM
eukprot:gene3519-8309_t